MCSVGAARDYDHGNMHAPWITVSEYVNRQFQFLVKSPQDEPRGSRGLACCMYKERLVALMDSFFDEPCKETAFLYRDHLVHPSLVWPNKVRGCEGGADHDAVGVAGQIQLPSFITWDCVFDGQVAEYCTAFFRVDIEVFAREPNHRLEISNEIVTFLLVLEIHLVCLG